MDASDTPDLCGLERIEWVQISPGRPVCQDPKGLPCRSEAEARSWRGGPDGMNCKASAGGLFLGQRTPCPIPVKTLGLLRSVEVLRGVFFWKDHSQVWFFPEELIDN